jgi:hypothetical protein
MSLRLEHGLVPSSLTMDEVVEADVAIGDGRIVCRRRRVGRRRIFGSVACSHDRAFSATCCAKGRRGMLSMRIARRREKPILKSLRRAFGVIDTGNMPPAGRDRVAEGDENNVHLTFSKAMTVSPLGKLAASVSAPLRYYRCKN